MRIQRALTCVAISTICARARFFHSPVMKTLALFAVPPSTDSNGSPEVVKVSSDTAQTPTSLNNSSSLSYENETATRGDSSSNVDSIEEVKVVEKEIEKPIEKETVNTEEDAYTGLESLSAASLSHLNKIESMKTKYQGKFVCTRIPQFPYCDVYLCGTLHVAKTSTDMVVDAIRTLKPHFVLLELCETRSDSLFEAEQQNVTLRDVLRETISQRSIKVFGMGLLSWMQMKSANMLGNKLGGEITAAYKVSAENGALGVILGDRLYGVTIQRVFDKLSTFEKIKVAFIMTWEVLTMSFMKLADYIKKTESDEKFIQEEIARFRKYLPSFATVIIDERDEYLSQSLVEIARVGFGQVPADFDFSRCPERRGRVLAVLGAGHLSGVQRWLAVGGVSDARLQEISSSSRHNSTWPGRGVLQVVNTAPSVPAPGRSDSGSISSNEKP